VKESSNGPKNNFAGSSVNMFRKKMMEEEKACLNDDNDEL
jgi:hypothetical protein